MILLSSIYIIYRSLVEYGKDNIKHLKTVFEFLKKKELYFKMSKCGFGKTSFVYLGYIVGNGHLKIDPTKVEFIVK
jgi:hypothetical protein